MDFTIRPARAKEYEALGDLTAQAYLQDGHLDFGADDPYLDRLRDVASRAAKAEVLVAVDGHGPDGTAPPLGTVTFAVAGTPLAEIARPGEAEFRMLAVDPAARGRGVGEALVRACLERARAAGCTGITLSTQRSMHAAHRVYERLGFVRTPDRDWEPVPGLVSLITYELTW
ncbi:GNAT family N-acetyltransferase [Streptomyces apocyni]|uniref:GNAT family N-acetyltransferase n=1 Tax=Streptomyces apocyni TaxID=2654677 RepID=UPI0012EADB41|nr:GNAT family N-acetyltransferase [Streptomyces apocyni]